MGLNQSAEILEWELDAVLQHLPVRPCSWTFLTCSSLVSPQQHVFLMDCFGNEQKKKMPQSVLCSGNNAEFYCCTVRVLRPERSSYLPSFGISTAVHRARIWNGSPFWNSYFWAFNWRGTKRCLYQLRLFRRRMSNMLIGSSVSSWLVDQQFSRVRVHVCDRNSEDNNVHGRALWISAGHREVGGISEERNPKMGADKRVGERIPCCFSNQEASSSSLGDLFSLSSPSCPNFQPLLTPRPPFLSFISPRLLSVGSSWTWLFRNDDRNAFRPAVLRKWLTCNAGRFSPRLILTAHLFSLE